MPKKPSGNKIFIPISSEEGAARIKAAAVKLYDRGDGQGVEWRTVTEALFRAAFDALDKLPDDACRTVARRVHEGSYSRVADGPRAAPGSSGDDPAGRYVELLHEAGTSPNKPW